MSENNTPQIWEKDVIKELLFTLHKEQVKDRRWRRGLTLVRSLGLILITIASLSLTSNFKGLPWQDTPSDRSHIAFIDIKGEIAAGADTDEDHLIPSMQAAFDNPHAKAVVLRINSPGGSPVQSGRIYDEIHAQKARHPEKQVIAIIDDLGASGGYYIAAAADKIYADKASLVGSIGVISGGFEFTGLMKKLGIERRVLTSGENKAMLDPFSPLSKEISSFWKKGLLSIHQQFIEKVKEGRGERLKDDPKIFSGLIWNGEQALELGLIDGLGSLSSVARDVVKETNLVDYSPRKPASHDMIKFFMHRAKSEASTLIHELATINLY